MTGRWSRRKGRVEIDRSRFAAHIGRRFLVFSTSRRVQRCMEGMINLGNNSDASCDGGGYDRPSPMKFSALYGHVFGRVLHFEVEGQRQNGRLKRTWRKQVEEESVKVGLRRKDAHYR